MQAGSLVECIDDRFDQRAFDYLVTMPQKGVLYIVREIVYDLDFNGGDRPGVLLEEIKNPFRWFRSSKTGLDYFLEPRFIISRFREVQPPMHVSILLEEVMEA